MLAAHPRRSIGLLALRYAMRELRSGLRGFYVFIACIALGVTAIAGVGSVASSLGDGLEREGRRLLGGDAAFSLIQREATSQERNFLEKNGKVSTAATLRAMARSADGQFVLVELKAVDGSYPMVGELKLDTPVRRNELFEEREGAFGAAADPVLLTRLGLKIGDRITVGSATFAVRSAIQSEPDKLAGGIGFGPRLLIGEAGLRATGLLQPGSLVRWTYRVRLPEGADNEKAAQVLIKASRETLPEAGWEVRSRANASPQLERNIERFSQFLTLVGLAALLVGGVGVANAVKSHLDRRRDVIATFKALGATGRDVFAIYLTQVAMLAMAGSLFGLVIGAALPFAISAIFGAVLPIPLEPSIQPDELVLSFIYGLLTALAFGLWPLARVHDTPVATLFRETVAGRLQWPRRRYMALTAAVVALLIAVAIGLAYDKRVAAAFVGVSMVTLAALRGIASMLMAFARRLPRPRGTMLRLALANTHRPGALTPSIVMSLGLGLTVLVTVTQIDGNLKRQFTAALPDHSPSFFFMDIPSTDAERFETFLQTQVAKAHIERVPMLRGRIVSARGVPAEDIKATPDSQWVLQSDRGITYTNDIPRGSKVVAGKWWDANYGGPPLVSLEKRIADGLGLKIGDTIGVNVLGREVSATIANLRVIDWQSLGINFVLVFTPNAFRGAPHTHLATLSEDAPTPEQDASIIKTVAETFPTVTTVRVRDAIQTVGSVVNNLVLAIRGASSVTLIAAILVLGGALAAGHRHKVYDAVILKTLGATRRRLIGAYALEYMMIGMATAAFGVLAGSIAAWLIVTRLMTLTFAWQAMSAAFVVILALAVTVGLGLIGTLFALNHKPATVLRNL